jgi:hypothetical protein
MMADSEFRERSDLLGPRPRGPADPCDPDALCRFEIQAIARYGIENRGARNRKAIDVAKPFGRRFGRIRTGSSDRIRLDGPASPN